jgi:hypothetical protein
LILAASVATVRRRNADSLLPETVMPSSLRWLASLVLLMSAATHVWADGPVPFCLGRPNRFPNVINTEPKTAPERECDLVIVRDASVKDAELRIPQRMMVADTGAPQNGTRTAMAGLALSAACVAGGLWCLRHRPREIPKKKLLIGVAVVALLFVAVTLVSYSEANGQDAPARIVMPTVQLGDIAVNVRIVDQGDAVELVLPPELADRIAAR